MERPTPSTKGLFHVTRHRKGTWNSLTGSWRSGRQNRRKVGQSSLPLPLPEKVVHPRSQSSNLFIGGFESRSRSSLPKLGFVLSQDF